MAVELPVRGAAGNSDTDMHLTPSDQKCCLPLSISRVSNFNGVGADVT